MALATISVWYVIIGVLAATGSMYLTHRFVPAKHESTLYGLFLIAIAAIYLVFTKYFGDTAATPLESIAVLSFAVTGVIGTRVPFVLIIGFVLHGGWDLMHEIQAQTQLDVFAGHAATKIPLGYGPFCATFDWLMPIYFGYRRRHWVAAWRAS